MKTEHNEVPVIVIRRLPRYYRYLGELLNQGINRISSASLSKKMGVTASQIRQDFNYFGGFGQQGYGYNVATLYDEIGKILGLNKTHHMIIIGAGNMGHALLNYTNLEKKGFKVIGIFDNDVRKIGKTIKGIEITNVDYLEDFCRKHTVDIATLSLPRDVVGEIAQRLINIGIKGLWTFSYSEISVPDDVAIESVHLSDSLMTLSYKLETK